MNPFLKRKRYQLAPQPLRAVETDTHKLCLSCKKNKLKSEFPTRGSYSTRLDSQCIQCRKDKARLKYKGTNKASK